MNKTKQLFPGIVEIEKETDGGICWTTLVNRDVLFASDDYKDMLDTTKRAIKLLNRVVNLINQVKESGIYSDGMTTEGTVEALLFSGDDVDVVAEELVHTLLGIN